VQGKLNGDLSSFGAGVVATGWLAYLGSFAAMVLVITLSGRARSTAAVLRRDASWWWFALGLSAIPVVLAMAGGIPLVGVAMAAVCAVAGQTVAGLGFDARGIGLAAPLRLTRRRAAAGAVAVLGLAIAVLGNGGARASAWVTVGIGVGLFAAGAIVCIQQAGNGMVAGIAGDPLVPALTASAGGTAGISIIFGAVAVTGGLDGITLPGADRWYLYLGGPIGALITVVAAWAVRRLGTFALTVAAVSGQMLMAVALDAGGKSGVSWPTAVAALTVCGAVGLAIPRRAR